MTREERGHFGQREGFRQRLEVWRSGLWFESWWGEQNSWNRLKEDTQNLWLIWTLSDDGPAGLDCPPGALKLRCDSLIPAGRCPHVGSFSHQWLHRLVLCSPSACRMESSSFWDVLHGKELGLTTLWGADLETFTLWFASLFRLLGPNPLNHQGT